MTEPREGLRRVEPYASPQLAVKVRLNTNECPYRLPGGFLLDLATRLEAIDFNRYPDREAVALRERLAVRAGHAPQGTWVANGSNEIILQILLAYGGPGRRALVFEPTYVLHSRLSWTTHTAVERVDLDEPFDITPDHLADAVAREPHVVFVCSPNNPTGAARPLEVTERLAEAIDALVVVDEAYIEFGGKSAVELVERFANVVVVRTFSKAFALAGARIGYCLAAPQVVEDLRRVRLPYHLSALTQAAGLTALDHADEAMEILDAVRAQRDRIVAAMASMPGLRYFPSDANFVLFRPSFPAGQVWQDLLDRGVLVRDLSEVVPGCLRVTAGTPEETGAFIEALQEVVT